MAKLKLSYFRHIIRQNSLEKTLMMVKNRRQQEKRKTKYEMDEFPKRNHRYESLAEQSY